MKALAIHAAEDIRWEEVPAVEPGADQVRLKIAYVGICGSDLHYYYQGKNGEYTIREPLVPGHELSAVVDLDPSGELAPGTPVAVHPARFGAPDPALPERPHLWAGGDFLGSAAVFPHRQGASAEYLVVDRGDLRPLPEGLPLQRAALAEPLGVALHAVTIAGDVSGARCLVLGAGPIGLLSVAALLHRGAGRVDVADLHAEPLARAQALGADQGLLVSREQPEVAAYDVVLECSSAAPSLTTAIRAVRPAGVVVQVGILPDAEMSVNLAPLVSKEVELRGTWRFAGEIDEALTVLAADARLDAVVTHTVPAAQAEQAFATARDSARSAKVLLELNP